MTNKIKGEINIIKSKKFFDILPKAVELCCKQGGITKIENISISIKDYEAKVIVLGE